MGYYIQTPENQDKAGQLLAMYPEIKEVDNPVFDATGHTVMVCVVRNGPFDACGIAYSHRELECFEHPDGRPRRWLVLPRELAVKLCPDVASELVPLAGNG